MCFEAYWAIANLPNYLRDSAFLSDTFLAVRLKDDLQKENFVRIHFEFFKAFAHSFLHSLRP